MTAVTGGEKNLLEGKIQAVKIHSEILQDDLWLILDRAFIPDDGSAFYFIDEIRFLENKTPAELKKIHEVKLVFPGSRVKYG